MTNNQDMNTVTDGAGGEAFINEDDMNSTIEEKNYPLKTNGTEDSIGLIDGEVGHGPD